ncbi:hypothetical protein ACSBR1_013589 [Camellia fascicularis]
MENVPPKLVEKTEEEDELSNISRRLLDFSDVDDFMVWATDDKVVQFCSWGTDTYASKEAAMNYVADVVIPHPWFRAICLDGQPIGEISVSPNRYGHSHVWGYIFWISTRGKVTPTCQPRCHVSRSLCSDDLGEAEVISEEIRIWD